MNRENALVAVIALLVGFIAGYLLHEVMAARQPAPRTAFSGPQAPAPGGVSPAPEAPATVPQEEIARLQAYVESNPEDADAVLLLANLNFEVQNWLRAAGLYEQYLDLRPDDPDALTDLGVCFRETAQYERALELFNRAQAVEPDHWQSRYNEVVVLAFDLQRPADAAAVLEELERLQPDNPSVTRLVEEFERLRGAA